MYEVGQPESAQQRVFAPDVSQLNEFGEDELLEQEQPVPLTEQEMPLWLADEPELEELLLFESEHAAMAATTASHTRELMRCFTVSTVRAPRDIIHGHSSRSSPRGQHARPRYVVEPRASRFFPSLSGGRSPGLPPSRERANTCVNSAPKNRIIELKLIHTRSTAKDPAAP